MPSVNELMADGSGVVLAFPMAFCIFIVSSVVVFPNVELIDLVVSFMSGVFTVGILASARVIAILLAVNFCDCLASLMIKVAMAVANLPRLIANDDMVPGDV